MKAAENKFLPFLEGKKQFIIPIYQRTYSWTREQCEQLWNDIVRSAKDDEIKGHFVGSIVYIQKDLYHVSAIQQLLVIDGQQRLTTLSLLLAALANVANISTSDLNISYEEINDSYLINKHAKDELHYKLMLTQSDKETLMSIVDGRDIPKPASQRIMENYRYFEGQIRQSGINPQTLYLGLSKLIIVDIALTQGQDNPQLIFESLNSTGMDLSQADLIRNYVLMGLDNDEQIKLYRSYWYPLEQNFGHAQNVALFNRFMRDYLTIKSKSGDIPKIDEVYTAFKTYQQSRITTPIDEIVADIYRYSGYFTKMALLQEHDNEIKQILDNINKLQVYVAYPFLLEVYDDYEHQRVSSVDFIAILNLVESYVFRRAICGIPTNSLNKIFATLAREIDKNNYLESVQVAFLQKGAGGRFPRDEEFRVEFVVKNMYNFRNRNYLLSKLENYERKEPVTVEEYTIEHIMPQNEQLSTAWHRELGQDWKNIHEKYLHTIGNLTLTGYNPELSDRSFREKRDMEGGFADSPLRLNRGFAKLENWNREEIEKRAQALADIAIKVWVIPKLTQQVLAKYSGIETTNGSKGYSLEDYPGLQGNLRKVFEHLRRRIMNLDPSVREEYKKMYIAYKTTTNFVDIEPQLKRLSLSLNMKFSEINDPQDLCRDLTGKGHYTNGDVEISVTSLDQIDYAMELVRQSFEKHWEDGDV